MKKHKYQIGQTIICTTLPESCFIVGVNEQNETYEVQWLMYPIDDFGGTRLAFSVAHKYYKEIEKVSYHELSYAKN